MLACGPELAPAGSPDCSDTVHLRLHVRFHYLMGFSTSQLAEKTKFMLSHILHRLIASRFMYMSCKLKYN
jgi:hypothetical protein